MHAEAEEAGEKNERLSQWYSADLFVFTVCSYCAAAALLPKRHPTSAV